jgi:hypothetical protein
MRNLLRPIETNGQLRNLYVIVNILSWAVVFVMTRNAVIVPKVAGGTAVLVAVLWPAANSNPKWVRGQMALSFLGIIVIFCISLLGSEPPAQALFGESFSAHTAWTEITKNDAHFAISFPGVPTESRSQTPSTLGTLDIHLLRFEVSRTALYEIDYAQVNDSLDAGKITALFDRIQDVARNMLRASNAPAPEITQIKDNVLNGLPSRDYVIEPGGGYPPTRVRLVFADHEFYRLMQTTVNPKRNNDQFFDSFRISSSSLSDTQVRPSLTDILGTWHVEKVICSSSGEKLKFYDKVYFTFTKDGKFISKNDGLSNDGKKIPSCSSGEETEYSISHTRSQSILKLAAAIHRDTCGGKERSLPARVAELTFGRDGTLKQTMENAHCDQGKGLRTWVLTKAALN